MIAAERAREAGGVLVFRNEDLDPERCRPEFVSAMFEDLRWLGIDWSEGPDCGGPHRPYSQSERREIYLAAWKAASRWRIYLSLYVFAEGTGAGGQCAE